MSVTVFTEEEQIGVLQGGWSMDGLVDGLFQVAVVGPGLQIILGVPDGNPAGPVEILAMTADGECALAAFTASLPELRRTIARHGGTEGWVRPHRNRGRLVASPEVMAQAIRMLAATLAQQHEKPTAGT